MSSKNLSPEYLEMLRCPVMMQRPDRTPESGRLRLVKDVWLVCDESGYKYPIRRGIPVMIIEEGAKWQSVSVDDLPVPPPAE